MLACRSIEQMAGGVERQIIALANELAGRNHRVALFTSDEDFAEAFYKIASDVDWYKLGMGDPALKASWSLRLKRMKKIRRIVRHFRPDILVGFQPGTFIGLRFYTLGMGLPMIASFRNAPSMFDFVSAGKYKNRIFQLLRMAERITVQFPSYRDGLPSFLRGRIRVVPNAISPAHERACPDRPSREGWILLAVGRLSFQKNYHLLIESFAKLAGRFPDWKLVIAGEGSERAKLERVVERWNIGHGVELPGNVDEVEKLYCRSHLFCQPSLWEGFPNALSEALAHGLPSVGFAACSGVNELITHGQNGFLARNEDSEEGNITSLMGALQRLMESPERRRSMGERAVKSIEHYRPERCFDEWEKVLGEVVPAQSREMGI